MNWGDRSIHTWSLVGVILSLTLQKKALLSFERPEIFTQHSITSQKCTLLATLLWEPRISCNKSVVYVTGPAGRAATAPVTSRREFCANFFTPEVLNGNVCRLRLKGDGTRAETTFRLSAKRTSPFKSAGASVDYWQPSCAHQRYNAGTPCSEVVWRVLATYSIRQFPLHFPSLTSPCAITFRTHYT
jgi:hypothetical protein